MTRKNKRNAVFLDRIADALIEDILGAPDAYLLAEAEADDDDGVALARAAFERASRTVALHKLSVSNARARRMQRPPTDIRSLDPETARDWLAKFIHRNPETAGELAAAARSSERLSDEDVYGMLEALQARGMLEQRGIEHGPR